MVKVTFPLSLYYLIFCSYLSQTLHPLDMRDNLACLNLLEGDYFAEKKEADWMDIQIFFLASWSNCYHLTVVDKPSVLFNVLCLCMMIFFSFATRQPAVVTGFCHHVWEVEWMWTSNAFFFKHSRVFFQRD